ncbi:MAG TPA: leucyl aminopeptidase [Pyrinomonadaceae bacterium]|jgi:leucyl aminopeptidase|nr:leucyl aminopeptidase [Pyrinomonadaceae bacterium]
MIKTESIPVEIGAQLPPPAPRDLIALLGFEGNPKLSNASGGVLRAVESLAEDGDFKGEAETTLLVHVATEEGARRLLLIGMGKHGSDDPTEYRRAASTAARQARDAKAQRLLLVVPTCYNADVVVAALAEGVTLGLYDNGFYQSREEETPALESVMLIAEEEDWYDARQVLGRARVVAESVNWARTLADEPGLSLPPREFARRAAEMAAEVGLKVESLGAEQIRALHMGGLLGVGQGSDEEPALIVLRHEPEGTSESDELWAFVGKGITFDTGGISIKHGLDMYEMKSDMAGGAAALGAIRAAALLGVPRRLAAVVPAAENMPSGKALKPGDIIRTFAGMTIECVDTDAEGRLVLTDGIAYAKHLGATRVVDLATLTGSIIVALGSHRAGLFSNDDEWAEAVLAASGRAGEPAWRMPVSDDYKKRIESMIADFKNYGGRPDATAAALLLSKFAGDTPWVHLDIAGTAWYDDATPYAPKGASGAGVRTLVELVCG